MPGERDRPHLPTNTFQGGVESSSHSLVKLLLVQSYPLIFLMDDSHPRLNFHVFQSDSSLFKLELFCLTFFCNYTVSLCLLILIALPWPHVSPSVPFQHLWAKANVFCLRRTGRLIAFSMKKGIFAPQKSQSQLYHYLLLSVHYS